MGTSTFTAYRWIKDITKEAGFSSHHGNHLYQYHCSDQNFERARLLLTSLVPSSETIDSLIPAEAAVFCFYAAEWWRRYYHNGPWTWNGIFDSLDLTQPSNKTLLYHIVKKGLSIWGLPILKQGGKRAFLLTLACEGGLPLKLLTKEGKHLQLYFRSLLEEFHFSHDKSTPQEIAEKCSYHLPNSLQKEEVYYLCGNLVKEIYSLRKQIGTVNNPIKTLDSKEPDWKKRLPLKLEDAIAKRLLTGLLSETIASTQKRTETIQIFTSLEKQNETWRICRRIHCPNTIKASEVFRLFNRDERKSLPERFQLFLKNTSQEKRLLAMATRKNNATGEETYLLESPGKGEIEFWGESACQELQLVLSTVVENCATPIAGGNILPETPWVFAATSDDQESLSWVGAGSLKTRHEKVFLLLTENTTLTTETGEVTQIETNIHHRTLYHAKGKLHIQEKHDSFQVKTKSEQEERYEYQWYGKTLSLGPSTSHIYIGMPYLIEFDEQGCSNKHIENRFLEWRPKHVKNGWKPVSADCLGEVFIRYCVDGIVRFRSTIFVLPKESKIELTPDETTCQGRVEIEGIPDCETEIRSETVEIEYQKPSNATHHFQIKSKNKSTSFLPLHLRWSQQRKMQFQIPFPSTRAYFIGVDGEILPDNSILSIDRLSGIKAQILCPPSNQSYLVRANIYAALPSSFVPSLLVEEIPLVCVRERYHEVQLRQLQEKLQLIFSMSDDLDAYWKLEIVSNDGIPRPVQKLLVYRYQGAFQQAKNDSIEVSPETADAINDETLKRLQVEARPIWKPEQEPILLQRTEQNCWRFSPETREPGPWIILGRDGEWNCMRPFLWNVRQEEVVAFSPEDPSLESIVKIANKDARHLRMEYLLERLAENPSNPDWQVLDSFLNTLGEIPETTFDIIDHLVNDPLTCALTLLKRDNKQFSQLWNGLERLPFLWHIIPIKVWKNAVRNDYRSFISEISDESLPEEIRELLIESKREEYSKFLEKIQERNFGIYGVLQWVFADLEISLSPEVQTPSLYKMLKESPEVAWSHLERSRQEFLRRNAKQSRVSWMVQESLIKSTFASIPENTLDVWHNWVFQVSKKFHPLVWAPILTALLCVWKLTIPQEILFDLKRLRSFDSEWFDEAYSWATLLILTETESNTPERIV